MGRIRRLLPSDGQPDPAESKIHTNAELADIKGLVTQARAQAEAARRDREMRETKTQAGVQRDHDERLRNIYAELAQRSCADPGSVTQAELDALPNPYDEHFKGIIPGELGGCGMTVYLNLRKGVDAEKIRRLSIPESSALPVNPYNPPRESAPSAYSPPPAFATAFPQLKEFAMTACASPEQVPLDRFLMQPYDFTHRSYDDMLAKDMSSGMSGCPKQLFLKLIELIRAGDRRRADRRWIRSAVAAYSRTPEESSGHAAPPPRQETSESGCFVDKYGTQGCPPR